MREGCSGCQQKESKSWCFNHHIDFSVVVHPIFPSFFLLTALSALKSIYEAFCAATMKNVGILLLVIHFLIKFNSARLKVNQNLKHQKSMRNGNDPINVRVKLEDVKTNKKSRDLFLTQGSSRMRMKLFHLCHHYHCRASISTKWSRKWEFLSFVICFYNIQEFWRFPLWFFLTIPFYDIQKLLIIREKLFPFRITLSSLACKKRGNKLKRKLLKSLDLWRQ